MWALAQAPLQPGPQTPSPEFSPPLAKGQLTLPKHKNGLQQGAKGPNPILLHDSCSQPWHGTGKPPRGVAWPGLQTLQWLPLGRLVWWTSSKEQLLGPQKLLPACAVPTLSEQLVGDGHRVAGPQIRRNPRVQTLLKHLNPVGKPQLGIGDTPHLSEPQSPTGHLCRAPTAQS